MGRLKKEPKPGRPKKRKNNYIKKRKKKVLTKTYSLSLNPIYAELVKDYVYTNGVSFSGFINDMLHKTVRKYNLKSPPKV